MKQKAFPAFGYFILKNDISSGEVVNDDTLRGNTYVNDENFLTVWLQIAGQATDTNESGETQLRVAGDSTLSKPLMPGKNQLVFDTDMVIFCVSPSANAQKNPVVPVLQPFSLLAGQTVTLPVGSRLFLADGKLSIGGVEVSGTRQISFSIDDKVCTAQTNCLGFLFV